MAITIKPKRSSTASQTPTTSNLEVGEIAVNLADKKIFVRDTSDNIFDLTEVVTDASPQLGGNLDTNGNDITGSGAIDIEGNISTDGTIDGDIIGNQSFYAKASAAITKGEVVMFTGAVGSNLLCAPADLSDSTFLPEHIMGIAAEDMALNDFGIIVAFGKVTGVDTDALESGIVDGDILYADPSVVGGVTTTKPTPTDHIIIVAAVTNAASNGTLQVRLTHEPDTDEVPEGSSNLYYTDARVQAVSINNVVEDTSPQLGGNLDLNSNDISGTGTLNITGNIIGDAITGASLGVTGEFTFPTADGASEQILQTNGSGTLTWVDITQAQTSGYVLGTLSAFPAADADADFFEGGTTTETYVGSSGAAGSDAFGVSLEAVFDCMDPKGSLVTNDMGVLT